MNLSPKIAATRMTALLAAIVLIGCGELKDDVTGPVPGTVTRLTFQTDVQPILNTQCVTCHAGGSAEGLYDLSSLSGVFGKGSDDIRNAIPGNASSLLLQVIQAGASHADRIGTTANAAALQKWVVTDSMGMAQPSVHPVGWMNVDSGQFHGDSLARDAWDMSGCQSCHGDDYDGGIAQSSCLQCHVDTPEDCSTCHGSIGPAPPLSLDGDVATSARGVGAHSSHLESGTSCTSCHVVPDDVYDAGHLDADGRAELTFGGVAVAGDADPTWDGTSCANVYCHGDASPKWTLVGGSEAACGTCHGLPPTTPGHPAVDACHLCHGDVVDSDLNIIDAGLHVNGSIDVSFVGHPEGFASPVGENSHVSAVRAAGWDLSSCNGCHGANYAGGFTDVSCLTCHPSTPEDCSVCHGTPFGGSPAPPRDLADNSATTARGVGAHQSHVTESDIARALDCSECHLEPEVFDAVGHIDTALPAEVVFGAIARTGEVEPIWNGETCSTTYCHGTFSSGNSVDPTWTEVGTGQADCGTCHGTPPVAPHPQVNACSLCHPRVADDDLNIIDKALHINGTVEIGSG